MSFNICIKKNPVFAWDENQKINNWDFSQGDRRLDFDFDGKDFNELHNFLGIKLPLAKQLDDESYRDYEERLKNKYVEAAKERGYEMLGRIWYWYESVSYLPSEINQLHEECLRIRQESENPDQIIAMDKLITACNEALKTNSGIFLASD